MDYLALLGLPIIRADMGRHNIYYFIPNKVKGRLYFGTTYYKDGSVDYDTFYFLDIAEWCICCDRLAELEIDKILGDEV
jgi:hypothetical protein